MNLLTSIQPRTDETKYIVLIQQGNCHRQTDKQVETEEEMMKSTGVESIVLCQHSTI